MLLLFQTCEEWHKFKLTQEQIDSYWTNGYLPNIRVLSEEQCDKLLDDYKMFLVSGTYVTGIACLQFLNLWF